MSRIDRPHDWFREELEAARAFNEALPEHCRLVVVRSGEGGAW